MLGRVKPAEARGAPPNPPNQGGTGKKDREIRFLGDLQRLRIEPGDRFVLTCEGPMPREVVQRLEEQWRQFVGADEPKVLVLDSSMKLGVINLPKEAV